MANAKRPYLNWSIQQLEALAASSWDKPGALAALAHELERRSTARARNLLLRLKRRLEEAAGDFVAVSSCQEATDVVARPIRNLDTTPPGPNDTFGFDAHADEEGPPPQGDPTWVDQPPPLGEEVGPPCDPEPARSVADWYRQRARPFLQQVAPDTLPGLDLASAEWEHALDGPTEIRACFVGPSGVGKSALINALICERLPILPQGGVGPLTAAAARVHYAEDPFFGASYHGPEYLEWLRDAVTNDGGEMVAPPVTPHPTVSPQMAKRMAQLLAHGTQFSGAKPAESVRFLQACLCDSDPAHGQPDEIDGTRAATVRNRVALAAGVRPHTRISAGERLPDFISEIREHLSGFLAPITADIEVGWHSDALRLGVSLVDLPGLGIANDEYRVVTEHWMRGARTVVLVVDRSGIPEAVIDLMSRNGFLEAILSHAEDLRAMPVDLVVAVTKLDLQADDARAREAQSCTGRRTPWIDVFKRVQADAVALVRAQLRSALEAYARGRSVPFERARIDTIVKNVPVCALSTHEHRRWYDLDREEPPRIKSVEDAGVTTLAEAINEQASYHRIAAVAPLSGALKDVMNGHGSGTSGETREQILARQLRRELHELVTSKG